MQASSADSDEDIFFSELPIVASASRLTQRLQDAPSSMTILDREIIKASGARDLNDLLRLVPGFQTFPNNTEPTRVSYHGLTDEDFSPRVQVLIDGRSQYSPLFRSGVNWNVLPIAIEDIERIEIVRGTNSVAYGNNAFLGVINIITVDPALAHGFSVSSNIGNQGVRDYTLRNGGKIGENGDFRFTYQQKDDSGLRDRSSWHDDFQSRLFDLRADFQLSTSDVLQFNLGSISATMPQGKIGSQGEPLHDFKQSSTFLQLAWKHILSADADLNLRYAWSRDAASDRFLAATGDTPAPTDYLYWDGSFYGSSIRQEIELQHSFHPTEHTRLAWGGGYRRDEVQSEANFYGNPRLGRSITRTFANLEWKPAQWFTGNLGGSIDHDSLAGSSFSPRLSGSAHLNPENTIRLGYARATRTGSLVDYKGDRRLNAFAQRDGTIVPASTMLYDRKFYGNPDMPSEKLESLEIGYLGDWRASRMSLDIRAFIEKIPNRLLSVERTVRQADLCEMASCGSITADFTTPVQRVQTEGIEYQWRWQPFETTRVMLGQALTRIKSEFLDSLVNDSSISINGNLVRWSALTNHSAPRLGSSLLLMQKLPYNMQFSTAAYKQGKMKWTQHSESDGYTRIDARLSHPLQVGKLQGELAYTAQSLNGAHGEFRAEGKADDRIVERRNWISLRLDY